MKKYLFVCTGNTCRSCMAEIYFKKIIKDKNIKNIDADSAGLSVFASAGASNGAKDIALENGLDLSSHKSKQLTEIMLNEAYVVLTMTQMHKKMIIEIFPEYKSKIFSLKEYVKESGDVKDPYGLPITHYRECFNQIKSCIDKINIE